MCDKYTISEKIKLVTLISALKDYNEVINSLRETRTHQGNPTEVIYGN